MAVGQPIDIQALSELRHIPLDDPEILTAAGWEKKIASVTRPLLNQVREEFKRRRPDHEEFVLSQRRDIKQRRQDYDSMYQQYVENSPVLNVAIGLDDKTGEHSDCLFAGIRFWSEQDKVEAMADRLKRQGILSPDDEYHLLSGEAFRGGGALYAGLFLPLEKVNQFESDELVDLIAATLVDWEDRLMKSYIARTDSQALYARSKEDEGWWQNWRDRCQKREKRLPEIRQRVQEFQDGSLALKGFRRSMNRESIDHPHWGFKGFSGQMFLNLLTKAHETVEDADLADQLARFLSAPATLEEGQRKIREMAELVQKVGEQSPENGLKSGYVPYFLTYFWQVQDPDDWLVYWPQTMRSYLEHLGWFESSGDPHTDYLDYREGAQALREQLVVSDQWDGWADEHPWWEVEGLTAWWRDHGQEEVVELPEEERSVVDRLNAFMLAHDYLFPRGLLTSYYLALQSKPFVILSGLSGTGKTKLAQLFAEFMASNDAQRAFVPVRPDWTDPRGLVGFHHLLTGTYHSTDFLQLLLRAHCDPEQRPHFILLDEMNLARVEYYFSDFLSAMESRRFSAERLSSETITSWEGTESSVPTVDQDPFLLHDQPRCLVAAGNETSAEGFYAADADQKTCTVACDGCPFSEFVDERYWDDGEQGYAEARDNGFDPRDFVPPRVTVPLNTYFTGTVNVDETTYSFSPKVLDRAHVLEFNQVDLSGYFEFDPAQRSAESARISDVRQWTAGYRYPFTATGRDQMARESSELASYRIQLGALVKILEPYHMHFGYRVADEILTFLVNAQRLQDPAFKLPLAFDRALLQKVLPKFHGSRSRLRSPLLAILAFCTEAGEPLEGDDASSVSARVAEQAADWEEETLSALSSMTDLAFRLPLTGKKILRLLQDLELDGFAGSLQ